MIQKDTICAIATGATNAGISIIRISGSESVNIADRIFVPKNKTKSVKTQKTHTLVYGDICENGKVYDSVLVSVMRAPHSYTGEDTVEINCHGGYFVTKNILELVIKHGARLAEPGEYSKRAYLNGKMDLSQAEAVIDIINATNEQSVKNSAMQLKGALSDKIKDLRSMILTDTAQIEAALDDPEHIDITGFSDVLSEHIDTEKEQIEKLISSFENGKFIQNGIKTVILGKPNVGKSTLLNTLTGTNRAIVTDIPGTTRDTLEEIITIDGITLKITDTAGIRETSDLVEGLGVKKAIDEIDTADLCLFVVDASRELDSDDLKILELIKNKNVIVLLNKSDLKQVVSKETLKEKTGFEPILISAKEETGIDNFVAEIKQLFGLGKIETQEEMFISRLRHKELLQDTANSLSEVKKSIDMGMPEDFFSIDLMNAYESLGKIIGEEIEDDLADKIFKDFCMGK